MQLVWVDSARLLLLSLFFGFASQSVLLFLLCLRLWRNMFLNQPAWLCWVWQPCICAVVDTFRRKNGMEQTKGLSCYSNIHHYRERLGPCGVIRVWGLSWLPRFMVAGCGQEVVKNHLQLSLQSWNTRTWASYSENWPVEQPLPAGYCSWVILNKNEPQTFKIFGVRDANKLLRGKRKLKVLFYHAICCPHEPSYFPCFYLQLTIFSLS